MAALYTLAATALALYGLHVVALVIQYLRFRNRRPATLNLPEGAHYPVVTVQVPLYNERYVAERCIDALAALDWPRDRLQIQILDDSTDDTPNIVRGRIEVHRRQGVDVTLLHRAQRDGYKAGALAAGLRSARGEYLALFDADFVPAPDFLKRMLPYFVDGTIGFVQARWAHLNDRRAVLAHALSIAVDGHFVVEQFARNQSGWPMIFNGSAGVWRTACVRASGGWQSDTLCEDMDLSYRAALAGWRCVFAPDVAVVQQEPATIQAIKSQHARWAKGGAQCLRKHAASILTAPRWSLMQKLMGFAYLAGYVAHLLMVLMVVLWLPLALDGQLLKHLPLTFLGLSGLGLPVEYVVAQWALSGRSGLGRLRYLPLLLVVGAGVSFSNARAVAQGLFTRGGEFHRTPKVGAGDVLAHGYLPHAEALAGLEIGLAVYAFVAALAMWRAGNPMTALFLLIYVAGFGSVGVGAWVEAVRAARWAAQAGIPPAAIGQAGQTVRYE